MSSKHPVTRCYKHASFFGVFGQHCLQERRDVTGYSNQLTTGFLLDCVSVCQNHRQGSWGTTSIHSSSNFELMMENASLRASLPVSVEALQRTRSGCQWKESVWVTGRIAKGIQSPCDACSKSSYICMFHLSNVPLSFCPSSH